MTARLERHLATGEPVTLAAAQRHLVAAFTDAGLDTPALDARWLIAGTLGLDKSAVLTTPDRRLTGTDVLQVLTAMHRRLAREPVSRILGIRDFHGLEFEVSPATLDPRPDTETLVEGVLRLVRDGECSGGRSQRIVDVGTGTGAILIALLAALPEATGTAVDIAPEALRVAARNAERHSVTSRMQFSQTSWLEGVEGPYDIVVSNPPYIPRADIEHLDPEVGRFDPSLALDGGLDGLDAYRAIIPGARRVLSPGGWLALEVGLNQHDVVKEIFNDNGLFWHLEELRNWRDLSGWVRCVAVRS